MVVAAAGVSVPMSPVINLVMGATPPERAGSAGSLMEMCGELGTALGVASLGSVVAAVYRLELPGRLPAGLSAESEALVREGVASAPAAAQQSPELAGQLMSAAQGAFTDAYNAIGLLGGVALLVTALVARRVLATSRRPQPDWTDDVEPGTP